MLNVIVGADVAPGDYPFTITGVSGSLIHTANAVLTVLVQGKYTVSITPPAQTVSRNSSSNYTVTITPLNGFHWTVDLAVEGASTHIAATLDSGSVGPSGTATLTVNVDATAGRGTHTLRVVGTSGQERKIGKVAITVH